MTVKIHAQGYYQYLTPFHLYYAKVFPTFAGQTRAMACETKLLLLLASQLLLLVDS